MSIKFHCEYCGKKIDAPDTAGGKRGKCPACHNKIYVPQMDEDDELKLAPIDETEEERQKRLLDETFQLTQHILQEKGATDGAGASGPSAGADEDEVREAITLYLRQMADGDLDNAKQTVQTIAAHRREAKAILEQMATSDTPAAALRDIPPQVLSGLVRNLRTRIS